MKEKSEEKLQAKYVDNSKYSFAHLVNDGFRHEKFEIYLKKVVDRRVASPHHFTWSPWWTAWRTGKDREMQNINETRKRFIKVGKRHAEAVNLARHGKFSEALKIAEEHRLTQPKSFVSSMERLSRSLTADIPSYRVEGDTVVSIRAVTRGRDARAMLN